MGKGVKRFEDFDAYQLSRELRDLVYRMTAAGPVLGDRKFREQIKDAAAKASGDSTRRNSSSTHGGRRRR
jgi:hypothetical protein